MCGIFGYARLKEGTMSLPELKECIELLAVDNEMRGRDSTGLATISGNGNIHLVRKVKEASIFLKNRKVQDYLSLTISRESRAILGHTRAATTGEVCIQNAQPFIYNSILGTHNGIVSNYESLFKKHGLKPNTTCDSEVIFALLSRADSLKEKAKMLNKLQGYYSLAFYDLRTPEKIFFARGNNVLTVFMAKDKSFLFWSSLEYPLFDIAEYLNADLVEVDLRDNQLMSIDRKGNIETERLKGYSDKRYSYNRQYDRFEDYYDRSRYLSTCAYCGNEKECSYDLNFGVDLCAACSRSVRQDFKETPRQKGQYYEEFYF